MLTDVQKQKMEQMFKSFDVNANGYMEKEDFEAIAQRISSGHGEAMPAAQKARLQTVFVEYWDSIRQAMDTDGDSRVSPAEYLGYIDRIIANPQGPEATVVFTLSELLFTSADHDGDGTISPTEFQAITGAYQIGERASQRVFELLDKDKDQHLTKDEFLGMIQDLVFGSDPNAPSALLATGIGQA